MRFTPISLLLKRVAMGVALALAAALPVKADVLELVNGDHYRGKVVGMDSNYVVFNSEIQGQVHLPRNKVAQITFVEVPTRVARTNAATATAAAALAAAPGVAPGIAAPIILSGPRSTSAAAPAVVAPPAAPAPAGTAEEVVAQMRREGVQPQLMNQIQEQIFGKASPEASQKFDQIMSGLMSGEISVQDLRKQAQSAIQQARDAKKDLGGDAGEMLDGYIGILQKFVAETTPTSTARATSASARPPAAAAPAK